MKRRKICVVTATRAEYGLLLPLLTQLYANPRVELQLVVTGAHLSARFGCTVQNIEEDRIPIAARVPISIDDDSAIGVTEALAATAIGIGRAFQELQPDLLVILGDRYEMLGAAQAAMLARIPIAHLHGGEATEGLIDEAIRHAITKMSHLHFVAAEAFRRRVIQLGEAPERVWTVGATGLDNIAQLSRMERAELEVELGIELRSPSFLVTHHPVTLQNGDAGTAIRTLLEVLDAYGGTIVITGVNADPGNQALRREVEQFAARRRNRVLAVESLGTRRYLSTAAVVDVVVGNSSSGLIEAPSLGTPTVDIGDRQRGRLYAPSVIHCSEREEDIRNAVRQALTADHRTIARQRRTPYGEPGAGQRIAAIVSSHPLEGLLLKRFYDLTSSTCP
jgi:UDP-hydrolysing UDP-N-acetyl-D-glucosamine 2-epimerase